MKQQKLKYNKTNEKLYHTHAQDQTNGRYTERRTQNERTGEEKEKIERNKNLKYTKVIIRATFS